VNAILPTFGTFTLGPKAGDIRQFGGIFIRV
jgi:hypothetical protein